MLDALANV